MTDQLTIGTSSGDDLEAALAELVQRYASSQDFHVNQPTTYHNVASLLEQFALRVKNMDQININLTRQCDETRNELSKSVARENHAFEENERLGAALATVKKMIELISGIRDTHHDREAQMLLVTRFITDALNPISPDDFSDIPF